jgi:hypothetical protein
MSFIDSTYFIGEIHIPDASIDTQVAQAITQYEKEILIQLLGYKLYSLLIADCTNFVPATQKYKDLVDGKEFTLTYHGEDILVKWGGLANPELQSLIAYYVYYKYVERDSTRLRASGVSMQVSNQNEAWTRVSPEGKLLNAWSRLRQLYGIIPVKYKSYYQDTFIPSRVFNADPSAYNFLYTNIADYPDWKFTPQWNINQFGL